MKSPEQKILGPIGDKINTFDRLFDEYIQLREISRQLASSQIPEDTDKKDADLVQIEILDKVKDLYKLWLGYVILLTYESTAVTEMAGRLFITDKVEELQKIIQKKRDTIFDPFTWAEMSSWKGYYIPWKKEDMPKTNVRGIAGDTCILGKVLYELAKVRNDKNDLDPLDDESYTFFIRYLLAIADKYPDGVQVIASFIEYATNQNHSKADEALTSEQLPDHIQGLKTAKNAWEIAMKYASFANAFVRKMSLVISDIDSPDHDITVKFLNMICTTQLTLENSDTPIARQVIGSLVRFLINEDLVLNQNSLITLMTAVTKNYILESSITSTIPDWVSEFEAAVHYIFSNSGEIVGTAEKFRNEIGEITAYEPEILVSDLHESVRYAFEYVQRGPEQRIIIASEELKDIGHATTFFQEIPKFNTTSSYFLVLSPDEKNNIINIQIFFCDELDTCTILSYAIDTFEDSFRLFPNVIDEHTLQEDGALKYALLYIFHHSILAEKTWNDVQRQRLEQRQKDYQQKKDHKVANKPNQPSYSPPPARKKGLPQRYHPRSGKKTKRNTDHNNPSTQELIQRVHTRRNAQEISIPDLQDPIWEAVNRNDVQNVVDKIGEFNSALLGGNIIANCKVFVGELRGPSNRKLMQIRCNDYRVLCELGQGKGSKATILSIFNRSQADEIY